jgi:signal transduction histidine kinase/BarA-like signal transduction histidine kinase
MQLSITKKLVIIIFLPLLLDAAEIFLFDFSAKTFSTMRAYVAGEGLWSKAQKDAFNALYKYTTTRNEADYQEYLRFLDVPLGDRHARMELQKAQPDLASADAGFIQGRNHPNDVRGMSLFFLRFQNAPFVREAFTVWAVADAKIEALQALGESLHGAIARGQSPRDIAPLLTELDRLNVELTALEDQFSFTLGEASRWARRLLIGIVVGTSLLFFVLSTAVPLYLGRSIAGSIAALHTAAQDFEAGKFPRIGMESRDELGALARAFNGMSEKLQESCHQLEQKVLERTQELSRTNAVLQQEVEHRKALEQELRGTNAVLQQEIEHRKALEQELRARAESLVEADRRKDEFLAVFAHELRNPLAPIVMTLELLKRRGIADPKLQGDLAVIERQVGFLTRIVHDLLDVSRIMHGTIELRRESVDLGPLVATAAETARPAVAARHQQLSLALPEAPLELAIDPLRIGQILTNLISNAVKFTPDGGRIGITVQQEGNAALVTVQDTGIGIAPEHLAKVFEAFFQAPQTVKGMKEGLGVGLMLARSLARLHGGEVMVRSEGLGKGSAFTLRLPLDAVRQLPLAKKRILVVDDNTALADVTVELLVYSGEEAQAAYEGASALQAVKTFKPDIIFLDIVMPGMDGYETARKIRAEAEGQRVVLIALTGYSQAEAVQKSKQAGFDAHVVKPLDSETLRKILAGEFERL